MVRRLGWSVCGAWKRDSINILARTRLSLMWALAESLARQPGEPAGIEGHLPVQGDSSSEEAPVGSLLLARDPELRKRLTKARLPRTESRDAEMMVQAESTWTPRSIFRVVAKLLMDRPSQVRAEARGGRD